MKIRIKKIPQETELNARHWKHDDGGYLFQGIGNSRLTFQNGQPYLTNNIGTFLPEINVVGDKPLPEDPRNTRGFTESNGTYYFNGIPTGEEPLQKDALTSLVEFGPSLAIGAGPAIGSTSTWLASKPALYNLGRMTLGSEIGGRSVDLASQLFTDNTWGQNVENVVEGITGWNPNNTTVGQFITDLTNPGYAGKAGISILPAISKLSKPIKSIISNKGFAIANASGHDIAWIPLNRKVNSNNISNIRLGVDWYGPTKGELGIGFIESGYPGEGRKLYDAAIKHANRYGYDGIISGEHLVSAPKTYRTYQHYYPDRKLVSNTGYWENINMRDGFQGLTKNANTIDEFMMFNDNGNAVQLNKAPVYRLDKPYSDVVLFKFPNFGKVKELPKKIK